MGMILQTEKQSSSMLSVQRQAGPCIKARRRLLLPERSESSERVIRYLTGRGIDREIIETCIDEGLLYESLPYHNCIFVGYDRQGTARYACFRATGPEKIMGDAAGSDKHFAFRIDRPRKTIHVFESAIDLLSFATVMKKQNGEWRAEPMVSLGGVHASGAGPGQMKLPAALTNALKQHDDVTSVALHLDNDFAGRCATESITQQLRGRYWVRDEPPPLGKDCNDYLVYLRQREAQQMARRKRIHDRER